MEKKPLQPSHTLPTTLNKVVQNPDCDLIQVSNTLEKEPVSLPKYINYIKFTQTPTCSIPIRMPGQTLSVECNEPKFEITLIGSGDGQGLIEPCQKNNFWISSSLHYALGRMVYDIVFDKNINELSGEINLSVNYSVFSKTLETNKMKLQLRNWEFKMEPKKWYKLPCTENSIKNIIIKKRDKTPLSCKFKIAIAGVPTFVVNFKSFNVENCQVYDFNLVNKSLTPPGLSFESGLNLTQVFGAWVVFDEVLSEELDIAYVF